MGRRLFEVNIWMWQYGRPFPRKFSAEEAVALQKKEGPGIRSRGAATLNSAQAGASCLKNGRARAMNVINNGNSDPISYTTRISYRYVLLCNYDVEVTNYNVKIDLRYWIRYRSFETPISKFMTY